MEIQEICHPGVYNVFPYNFGFVRGELRLVANPPPYTTETLFSASNLDSAMTRQVQT